jgi:hypothetical protein
VWVPFFFFFFPSEPLHSYPSGHYILWREGVKYGDIAISNLTHRNGNGVFNDLDYSITPHSRKFDRNGATAFLALDLINRDGTVKAERRYRHGLESLFWVLLWISSCYDDNVRTIPANQRRWLDRDIVNSCNRRHTILSWAEQIPMTESYQALAGPIILFRRYWRVYFHEQSKIRDSLLSDWDSSGLTNSEELTAESAEDVERMLFTLHGTFKDPEVADILEQRGLMPDIPRALFPNYSEFQSVVRIEFAGGANHG